MNTPGTAVMGRLSVNWGGAAAIVCASVIDLHAVTPAAHSPPQSQTPAAKGPGQEPLSVLGRSGLSAGTRHLTLQSSTSTAGADWKARSSEHTEQNTPLLKRHSYFFFFPNTTCGSIRSETVNSLDHRLKNIALET